MSIIKQLVGICITPSTGNELILVDSNTLLTSCASSTNSGTFTVTTTGVKATNTFKYTAQRSIIISGRVIVRVRYKVTDVSTNAYTARARLTLLRDGEVIVPLSTVASSNQTLGTVLGETMDKAIPINVDNVQLGVNDTLEAQMEFEIVSAALSGADDTGAVEILHDLAEPGNEFSVELPIGG